MEIIFVTYSILIKVLQRRPIHNGAYPASRQVYLLHTHGKPSDNGVSMNNKSGKCKLN